MAWTITLFASAVALTTIGFEKHNRLLVRKKMVVDCVQMFKAIGKPYFPVLTTPDCTKLKRLDKVTFCNIAINLGEHTLMPPMTLMIDPIYSLKAPKQTYILTIHETQFQVWFNLLQMNLLRFKVFMKL